MAKNLVQVEAATTVATAQFSLKTRAKPNHGENCYQIFLSLKYEESYLNSKFLGPKVLFQERTRGSFQVVVL